MRNLLTLLVLLPLFTFGQEINTQKDSSYTAPTNQQVYDDGLTMQQRGNRDAFRYYEGYKGARTGTIDDICGRHRRAHPGHRLLVYTPKREEPVLPR